VGQTPTDTVREIERTRRRLDSELEALQTYLPPATSQIKRGAAIAAGACAAAMLLMLALRRRRRHEVRRRLRAIEDRLERMEVRRRR
jgi:C4-dicarboxylate-specific signal transduction histidine kinase